MLSHPTTTDQTQATATSASGAADGALALSSVPNLVVIGAMKASTTTFYELINRHPNVWFPSEKEPHYFTSPDYGQASAWKAYLQLFEDAPAEATIVGEASTGYSKLPHFGDTPQRLADALESPRFIYLIRDPVERTISNFHHSHLAGHFQPDTTLATAIKQDPILVDASCYARQIRAYHDVFPSNRLLIVTTNELHASPSETMQRVEQFLDLPTFDGWDAPLPQSNAKQALAGSLATQSKLPAPLVGAAKKMLPAGLKNGIKSLLASTPKLPEITADERQLVFDQVADDLSDLWSMLGDQIAAWPSVQKLEAS